MDLYREFLDGWLRLSAIVRNDRLVKHLSFQESFVCNIVERNAREGRSTTATDIVQETGKLKSQINRVLSDMEKKELICRKRSTKDQREILLEITPKGKELYKKEHEQVMTIIKQLFRTLGEERVKALIEDFDIITKTIHQMDI